MYGGLVFTYKSPFIHDGWRKGVIVHEHTSHPSIETLDPLTRLLSINLVWPRLDWFSIFNTNFGAKSTKKSNLWVAYGFKTIIFEGMNEWEMNSYAIIPSLSTWWMSSHNLHATKPKSSPHMGACLYKYKYVCVCSWPFQCRHLLNYSKP